MEDNGKNITKKLVDEFGISKYRISRATSTNWSTVQLWYRDVFKPNENHQKILNEFLEKLKC